MTPEEIANLLLDSWSGTPLIELAYANIIVESTPLTALAQAERLRPPILIITFNHCPHYIQWLRELNWSVMVQPRNSEMIVSALKSVENGGLVYIGPDLRGMVPLFPRERSILYQLALGLDNEEIASQRDISVKSVANVIHDILDKLHLKNRVEAALYFRGLLPTETERATIRVLGGGAGGRA